ncbi:HNH endonuclease signature motif containing protein [Microcella alkalica]
MRRVFDELIAAAELDELTAGISAGLASSRTDALLGALVECEVRASRIAARRIELAHELRVEQERIERGRAEREQTGSSASSATQWDPRISARRSASAELACALRITSRTADSLLARAATLITTLPVTMEALRDGRVAFAHAAVIADAADSLPEGSRAEFERAILPSAEAQNPSRLTSRARVLRERMHPESIAARRAEAMATRDVFVDPVADGMAWLSALLPAEKAHGAYRRLTRIAESLEDGHDAREAGLGTGANSARRTLGNRRADALADLLIAGEVDASGLGLGMRAEVHVTVPVLTLLGQSGGAPATLEGYGPIDDDIARRLAATAPSFTRILTHPETGVVLSVGRDRYRVPADLQTWLRVRDGTCRFPGCARSAARCDLDHTRDWQHGGGTSHDNLAHLCRHHHRLKHQTGWTVAQEPGGVLRWRAPSGRSYSSEPETVLDAVPPGAVPAGEVALAPPGCAPPG